MTRVTILTLLCSALLTAQAPADREVLAPFTNAQRKVSYATARMDFYHATFLTGQALVLASKARALMMGRYCVAYEDIQALAAPVLRHRILANFTAASEGITTDTVVERILKETPSREGELTKDERFKRIFAS